MSYINIKCKENVQGALTVTKNEITEWYLQFAIWDGKVVCRPEATVTVTPVWLLMPSLTVSSMGVGPHDAGYMTGTQHVFSELKCS